MCRNNIVVNRLMLGNRELGWEVWNGKNVEEYTSKQLQDMIRNGKDKVYGLCVGADGELEADKEGFFTTSIMEHRHVGNYRAVDSDIPVNMAYICYGTCEAKGEVLYKCISNKFEQMQLSEEQLKAYLTLGILTGGARIKDGKIECVEVGAEKKQTDVSVQEEPDKDSKELVEKNEEKKAVSKKEEKSKLSSGKQVTSKGGK